MTKYIQNKETISGRLQDELVMLDLLKGKYFALNPVATRIWDLLDKSLCIEELCVILTEEYEVSAEVCMKETQDLINEMLNLGLVKEA